MPKIYKIGTVELNEENENNFFFNACEIAKHEEIVQIGTRYFQMFYGPEHDLWTEVDKDTQNL